MKFKLAVLIILLALLLGKLAYDQLVPPFAIGDPAPDFSLSDLDGSTVRLTDLKGTPLLVHFWATWCTQCVEEMPLLNSFAIAVKDIKVLAISEDDGGVDAVLSFFGKIKPEFTVLLDPEGRVADRYKSYKVPETYLIDKDGRIIHRFVGAVSWTSPKVIGSIRQKLGDQYQNGL